MSKHRSLFTELSRDRESRHFTLYYCRRNKISVTLLIFTNDVPFTDYIIVVFHSQVILMGLMMDIIFDSITFVDYTWSIKCLCWSQ